MMSNEELERIMNFIVKRQEYATEQIARLTESQTRFDEALARLAEQQGDHEERIARFERSYVRIAQLLEKHDGQLDAVTAGLNNVTAGPTSATTPEKSVPQITGNRKFRTALSIPLRSFQSMGFTLLAWTCTRTPFGPTMGTGMSSTCKTSGPP